MKVLVLIFLAATMLEVAPTPCNNRYGTAGQGTPTVIVVQPQGQPANGGNGVAPGTAGAQVTAGRRKRNAEHPAAPPPQEEAKGKGLKIETKVGPIGGKLSLQSSSQSHSQRMMEESAVAHSAGRSSKHGQESASSKASWGSLAVGAHGHGHGVAAGSFSKENSASKLAGEGSEHHVSLGQRKLEAGKASSSNSAAVFGQAAGGSLDLSKVAEKSAAAAGSGSAGSRHSHASQASGSVSGAQGHLNAAQAAHEATGASHQHAKVSEHAGASHAAGGASVALKKALGLTLAAGGAKHGAKTTTGLASEQTQRLGLAHAGTAAAQVGHGSLDKVKVGASGASAHSAGLKADLAHGAEAGSHSVADLGKAGAAAAQLAGKNAGSATFAVLNHAKGHAEAGADALQKVALGVKQKADTAHGIVHGAAASAGKEMGGLANTKASLSIGVKG